MLKMIIAFIVFIIILFLYLHIQFHLKTSEDVEMFEVDWPSKEKLEQVCDLRQPLLFNFECQDVLSYINSNTFLSHHPSLEMKVRNIEEPNNHSELYVPLQIHLASKLFKEDKCGNYFSEKNSDFLHESGLIKVMKNSDSILKPYMLSSSSYDVILGSANSYTPFRYEIGYRNYLLLTQGSAEIKLAPPNNISHLYPHNDYENMEFRSPINPWNPQDKYISDFKNVKTIDFTLLPGKTLYIPAYWLYSIKFNTYNTTLCSFKYKTYMNTVAIMPQLCLHMLQLQNIKHKIAKKFTGDKKGDPLSETLTSQEYQDEVISDKKEGACLGDDNNIEEEKNEVIQNNLVINKEINQEPDLPSREKDSIIE